MLAAEKEEALLEKAEAEEKSYNWVKAAELYEQVAESYLERGLSDKAADFYRKAGYSYLDAGSNVNTAEEYRERYECAFQAFNDAEHIFKQIGSIPGELESKAGINAAKGFIGDSVIEIKEFFNKSYEFFIESSTLYSKKGERESLARVILRAVEILIYAYRFYNDPKELEQICKKGIEISEKGWLLSKEIKHNYFLAGSLFAEMLFRDMLRGIINFKPNDFIKQNLWKLLLRCNETIDFIKNCDDFRVLGFVYFTAGSVYCFFGYHFIDNETKQREYLDQGLEFFKKGLDSARKANIKPLIIYSLFSLTWWGIFGGKIEYVQKRIVSDVKEVIKLGKIYEHTLNQIATALYFFPMNYYNNIAQMSFLATKQRKIYAQKAIKYGKKHLEKFSSMFGVHTVYAALTWSYALLATLTIEKNEKEMYVRNMLQFANKANEIGQRFEGGFPRAAGYSSLYRAYKTLADITENEEEQIKMLKKAIDAQKKYIPCSVESRTGTISAKMRLGLLYEELGTITGDLNSLLEVRKIFLGINKESIERGYYSYAATINQYLARLEDRLGNHSASAENYKLAQGIFEKSLRIIEYKPLKKRVIEKINYAEAWSFIEQAKIYHKREEHLKAKDNYNKASEILKTIRRYNYEAPYYASWSILEEAEQLSKEEKQKEAIEKYETAKNTFEASFKTLEQTLERSKQKDEREIIQKLMKVANLRIDYCSARIELEKGRILGKQRKHLAAADSFASAASQFRNICTLFKIEREQKELEAIYYLCRAWESMELAENYEDPGRFAEAAQLFTKSSDNFIDRKLKLLTSGNSIYCQALEYGCKFDKTIDLKNKSKLYPKVKSMLRNAAEIYRKGGYKSGADWALATSTYFDAGWYLLKADEEEEINEKTKLLEIGSGNLESALELFDKAGYKEKVKDIQEQLDTVKREEKIILTALNTVKRPSVSASTKGIIAPACPIETSQSPRMSEIRELEAETRRVLTRRASMEKSKFDSKEFHKVKRDTL